MIFFKFIINQFKFIFYIKTKFIRINIIYFYLNYTLKLKFYLSLSFKELFLNNLISSFKRIENEQISAPIHNIVYIYIYIYIYIKQNWWIVFMYIIAINLNFINRA